MMRMDLWEESESIISNGWIGYADVRAGGAIPLADGCSYDWCRWTPKELL